MRNFAVTIPIAAFFVCGLLLLLAAFLNFGTRKDLAHSATEWLQSGAVITSESSAISEVAGRFSVGTAYDSKANVNAPFRSGALNIYIIDPSKASSGDQFSCNCSAFPADATIICDAGFLQQFRNLLTGDSNATPSAAPKDLFEQEEDTLRARIPDRIPQRRHISRAFAPLLAKPFQDFMIGWLLAHEIGHITRGIPNTGIISNDVFNSLKQQFPGQEEELIADLNYLAHLLDDGQERAGAHVAMSYAISAIRGSYPTGEDRSVPGNEAIFVHMAPGRHPAMLLRLLNLASVFVRVFPGYDTPEYFDKLRSSVILLPEVQPEILAICTPRSNLSSGGRIEISSDCLRRNLLDCFHLGYDRIRTLDTTTTVFRRDAV